MTKKTMDNIRKWHRDIEALIIDFQFADDSCIEMLAYYLEAAKRIGEDIKNGE